MLIFIPLGAICYEISNYIRNFNLSIVIAILFTINIAITFSNQSYIDQIFKSNVWQKLGQFGFIMFLNNCAIRKVLLNRNYGLSYKKISSDDFVGNSHEKITREIWRKVK